MVAVGQGSGCRGRLPERIAHACGDCRLTMERTSGLLVIPAQARIQIVALDSRPRFHEARHSEEMSAATDS